MPDGTGIGSRLDLSIQGFAQRDGECVESVVQALFTAEPVEKGVPFPSLQFGPAPGGTARVTSTGVQVLIVGGHGSRTILGKVFESPSVASGNI